MIRREGGVGLGHRQAANEVTVVREENIENVTFHMGRAVMSCERLDSNTKLQRTFERREVPEREDQHISGRLKSPMTMRNSQFEERVNRKSIS